MFVRRSASVAVPMVISPFGIFIIKRWLDSSKGIQTELRVSIYPPMVVNCGPVVSIIPFGLGISEKEDNCNSMTSRLRLVTVRS